MTQTQNTREVKFELSDVKNKFLHHLHRTNQVVAHFYHAIKNYEVETIPLLETDSLPFIIDGLPSFDKDQLKIESQTWLFKKAFEELIVGLTESLVAAHKIFMAFDLANQSKAGKFSETELNEKLDKIHNRPSKLNFPTLLYELRNLAGIDLLFSDELISINQIRNCLVHRNGIVSIQDINDISQNGLTLLYVDLITYAEKNGELIQMTWDHKKEPFVTSKIGFQAKPKKVFFRIDERVVLDQNIFNGVSFTSIEFVTNLFTLAQRFKAGQPNIDNQEAK